MPSYKYYCLYPDKVLTGPTKHIAYSYIIETISLNVDKRVPSISSIVEKNAPTIISKYTEKYGKITDDYSYGDDTGVDFIAIKPIAFFAIEYSNHRYIDNLTSKYNEFQVNANLQKSKGLNSNNDI